MNLVKNLFNWLFNIRTNVEVERPKSFTETPLAKSADKMVNVKTKLPVISELKASVDIAALFYSLLFPTREKDSGGVANNLEKRVIAEVENALADPQPIADNVLKLPNKMAELDEKLADPNFDTRALIELIERDPVLVVEVLTLCNSPAYRRGDKAISSLSQAVVQLGRDQLRRFVTTCLVREMIDIKPIYFRRFGAEIWRHSMQVAFLAGYLAKDEDPDEAFLLGLLHDVGKIAIFKMLLDALLLAEPDEQPNSWLFRQLMTNKSLILSSLLAKCWQLPPVLAIELERLANVDARPTSGLAAVVWRANMISECSMLYQADKLNSELLKNLLGVLGLTEEAFFELHEKLIGFQ